MKSLTALALALLSTVGSAQAAGDPSDLFGRGWVSTAVLKHGEEHPLFEGIKIRINFDHRSDYDVVRWNADCNYFGADVHATKERLFTGQVSGTDMGCSGDPRLRDRWMLRFFRYDARWRIRQDDRLKLTRGDRVIKLRRATSPPPDR